jgi:hypothetical protein
MKNKICNYILLFLIITICLYVSSNANTYSEGFTPKIREFYRPYVRNSRIFSESLYNKHKTNVTNLFRKFGII